MKTQVRCIVEKPQTDLENSYIVNRKLADMTVNGASKVAKDIKHMLLVTGDQPVLGVVKS